MKLPTLRECLWWATVPATFGALILAAPLIAKIPGFQPPARADFSPAVDPYPGDTDTPAEKIYRTKTGKKYHRDDCKYVSRSKIEITRTDAETLRLAPCKVCKPDGKRPERVTARRSTYSPRGVRCPSQ